MPNFGFKIFGGCRTVCPLRRRILRTNSGDCYGCVEPPSRSEDYADCHATFLGVFANATCDFTAFTTGRPAAAMALMPAALMDGNREALYGRQTVTKCPKSPAQAALHAFPSLSVLNMCEGLPRAHSCWRSGLPEQAPAAVPKNDTRSDC